MLFNFIIECYLFLGFGFFFGVIDMFGSGGGLFDYRVVLLVFRGFCVFVLLFFVYEDLLKFLLDVLLDYLIVGEIIRILYMLDV